MCNSKFDRPLPSSKDPFFQNEAKRTTFLVKMSLTCMRKKGHFHVKGWALNRVLIQRPGEVWNGLFSRFFFYVWEQLFFTSAWRPFINGDFKKKLELKALGKIELILMVLSVQRYHCDYHCTKYTYRFCSAYRWTCPPVTVVCLSVFSRPVSKTHNLFVRKVFEVNQESVGQISTSFKELHLNCLSHSNGYRIMS